MGLDDGIVPAPNELSRRGNAIYFYGDCTAENMYKIKEHLMDIRMGRDNQYAALIINSPGGTADTMAFYDWLKAYPLPLITFVEGMCCSAATTLYLAGKMRYISPTSLFLIHSANSEFHGILKEGTAKDEYDIMLSINTGIMRKIYTAETKLTKQQLNELLAYREKFLNARECIKYGISHKIGVFVEGMA